MRAHAATKAADKRAIEAQHREALVLQREEVHMYYIYAIYMYIRICIYVCIMCVCMYVCMYV
jgi:hypothetical protein